VATINGLGESSAVKIVGNCLQTLNANTENHAILDWELRIGQRSYEQVKAEVESSGRPISNLPSTCEERAEGHSQVDHRNLSTNALSVQDPRFSSSSLIYQVPLFNLWDSISFIYTKPVEPIGDQLLVELHLYQFWTIIQILKGCFNYFSSFAKPLQLPQQPGPNDVQGERFTLSHLAQPV